MSRGAAPRGARRCAALAFPAASLGARSHVGIEQGAGPAAVARAIERATGARVERLAPIPALTVDRRPRGAPSRSRGRCVEPRARAPLAFDADRPARLAPVVRDREPVPTTPGQTLPPLAPVRVAVIDSGSISGTPISRGASSLAKSFVSGTAQDTRGHGTIVAGIIAAELDNATGIAGLSPAAELLVAKVVAPDGTIPVEAEAKAIRWAVDSGARVINMSLGGVRDPSNPEPRHVLAARGGGGGATRCPAAPSSSRPSGTATRRRARRGTSRATLPRCPTSSA